MENLKTIQAFHQYLNYTENWAYRLIKNIPETKHFIVSKEFLKYNFYDSRFEYIEFPIKRINIKNKTLPIKIYNRFVLYLLKTYPSYIKSMLKKEKIDILHSHFAFTGYDYLPLAKKLNVKHVVSFYGLDYEFLPYNWPEWEKKYKKLFKEADLFICEGKHGAKILKGKGCPPEKVVVNKLGVEVDKIPFYKREKKKYSLKLVQVASFREKKGHIYTVQAFHKALENCPNMHLTLVGEGELKEKIKNLVKKLKIEDKVTFLGKIDYENLYEFLKDFDVFIHPSCYTENRDCEGGAPVVLLDAQATGLPVISTRHCDIPEEVIHGKTGLLSREKDIDELAKNIEFFYKMDKDMYAIFSETARKHIEREYDIKKNAKNLLSLYRDLLKNGR
ncbi:MAG: glycosyltransferase family 4 protein [Aquificae bacterium]|nr:glycosyltransferase family 4 protein [Aquificota bacterium]